MRLIDADEVKEDFSEILEHDYEDDYARGFQAALVAVLGYKAITPPPNDPLTLEQLREMDGEPVYDRMGHEWFIVAEVTDDEVIMTDGTVFDIDEDSPNTVDRRFCRRKPEEGTM